MNWYAAHLIMYVKLKDRAQDRVPVWENVVLVRAASEQKAFDKAQRRGLEDAGDDDGTFRWGGQPAMWVFAGVRKLTLCEDGDQRPGDGTEITFAEFVVSSLDDLEKLVAGKPILVEVNEKARRVHGSRYATANSRRNGKSTRPSA